MSKEGESCTDLSSLKDAVHQRLQQREDERLAIIEQKKLEKQATSLTSEQVPYFAQKFSEIKSDIEKKLQSTSDLEQRVLSEHFDNVADQLRKLQKFVSDSSMFLPSYDIRASQAVLKDLQQKFQEQQDSFQPKKKFAFKSRKKENATHVSKPLVSATDEVDSRVKEAQVSACGFHDVTDGKLTLDADELKNRDVELSNLSKCKVVLLGSPNTIHMNNLTHCQVLIGPVNTSVFIDDCRSCEFAVACQQLRVHLTTESDFYVHVVSTPIIEDCRSVRFAPYNLKYENLDKHYECMLLDKMTNNWNKVNDFNWLSTDEPSPHWKVVPENERKIVWEI